MSVALRPARPTQPGSRAAGPVLAALLFAALPAAAVAGNEARWHLSLRSQQHSDATALNLGRDPRAEDLAPRSGRNLAYIDDELRLWRHSGGGWTAGLLARSRATLVASADTLALYQQVDGGAAVTTDRRWAIDARFRGFSGGGLVFGRAHDLGAGWSTQWEWQVLVLQRWRERQITGAASAGAGGVYDFALQSRQRDDRLRFPFQADYPSRGGALLGGLTMVWQGGSWQFEAAVKDAGWQRWRGLPRQDAALDSRTGAVDADGFLIYRPLIQGQNTQATARRSAPAWGRLVSRWKSASQGKASVEAGADLLPGFGPLPWVGVAAPVGASDLALQWRTHERRLTLQWAWRGLTLTAGADRLGGGARSRDLGLAWQLPI